MEGNRITSAHVLTKSGLGTHFTREKAALKRNGSRSGGFWIGCLPKVLIGKDGARMDAAQHEASILELVGVWGAGARPKKDGPIGLNAPWTTL